MSYEVLHITTFLRPHEVLHVADIWRHMECFIFLLLMSILEEKQRAPQDLFLVLLGVLHKPLNCCHLEYSIWRFSGTIWSALQLTLNEQYKCYLKYSIWSLFDAIWSTPCGRYFLPYGVLHIFISNKSCGVLYISSTINILQNVMKNSMWPQISAIWSTPYGIIKQPYGVLHMAIDFDLCDES